MKALVQPGDEMCRFMGESDKIDRYGSTLCLMRKGFVVYTIYIPLQMYYLKGDANHSQEPAPSAVH